MTLKVRKNFLSNKKVLTLKKMINMLKFCIIKSSRNKGKKVTFLEKIFTTT